MGFAPQTSYPTAMGVAILGMLADAAGRMVETRVNDAAGEIPIGNPIKAGASDPACQVITATTDTPDGIAIFSQVYVKGDHLPDLGATGIKQGAEVNSLRSGRFWGMAGIGGVARTNRLYWNVTTGRWVAAAVGGQTIDMTSQAVARTGAVSGGLFIVEIDFRNK